MTFQFYLTCSDFLHVLHSICFIILLWLSSYMDSYIGSYVGSYREDNELRPTNWGLIRWLWLCVFCLCLWSYYDYDYASYCDHVYDRNMIMVQFVFMEKVRVILLNHMRIAMLFCILCTLNLRLIILTTCVLWLMHSTMPSVVFMLLVLCFCVCMLSSYAHRICRLCYYDDEYSHSCVCAFAFVMLRIMVVIILRSGITVGTRTGITIGICL